MKRSDCKNKDRCGSTGHYRDETGWRRCACLEDEIHQRELGPMYAPQLARDTKLLTMREQNLCFEGPLTSIRPHIGAALMRTRQERKSFRVIDAYRLIEIFLEKDAEYDTAFPIVDCDLLVVLLGFGDPRNRYLPELFVQTLSRRELLRKPSWCVLGLDLPQVAHKYSEELRAKLATYQRVVLK